MYYKIFYFNRFCWGVFFIYNIYKVMVGKTKCRKYILTLSGVPRNCRILYGKILSLL